MITLTQDPSNLIIDLYISDDALVKKLKNMHARRLRGDQPKSKKKVKSKVAGRKKAKPRVEDTRTPAFAEFLFTDGDENQEPPPAPEDMVNLGSVESLNDLFDFSQLNFGDANTLEANVIEARGNIYLRFPLLDLPNRHLEELRRFPPEYEIKKSFSDENKQARFLLHLFNTRAYASFIKGKRLYRHTFPQSKYDEILDYIEADVWIKLWEKEKKREFFS